MVHGGRGRRHGDAKGIGGKAVGEGGVGEDAGAGLGEKSVCGCRVRRAWRQAGGWACTMCLAGRLEEGRRTLSQCGMQWRPWAPL